MDEFARDSSDTSPSYSPDNFYTGASNKKGFSQRLYFRVSPELQGELGALVASRIFPDYTTVNDFHRDALVHRLHYLQDHIDDPAWQARLAQQARRQMVFSKLEEELHRVQENKRAYDWAMELMTASPAIGTVGSIRAIILELSDTEQKIRLTHALEDYERRYQSPLPPSQP